METKTIILTYFSLNMLSIILAYIFIGLIILGIAILWMTLVRTQHNNYCSPIILLLFGEKACNKTIFKTVTDEIQPQTDEIYSIIKNHRSVMNTEIENQKLIAQKNKNNQLEKENATTAYLVDNLTTIEQLKKSIQDIYGLMEKHAHIVNDTVTGYNQMVQKNIQNMQTMLQNVAHQINIAYVTPGLVQFVDPLTKLYGIMAETVNQPTTPKMKSTQKIDLTNEFKESDKIYNAVSG